MTFHKHEQFLQFHRPSLLQCDDGRSLLITQDRQQTDDRRTEVSNQRTFVYCIKYRWQLDRLSASSCAAVMLLNNFGPPVLRRFYLGPSCLTTKFYQTIVWVCDCFLLFFTTVKFDPIPTTVTKVTDSSAKVTEELVQTVDVCDEDETSRGTLQIKLYTFYIVTATR